MDSLPFSWLLVLFLLGACICGLLHVFMLSFKLFIIIQQRKAIIVGFSGLWHALKNMLKIFVQFGIIECICKIWKTSLTTFTMKTFDITTWPLLRTKAARIDRVQISKMFFYETQHLHLVFALVRFLLFVWIEWMRDRQKIWLLFAVWSDCFLSAEFNSKQFKAITVWTRVKVE